MRATDFGQARERSSEVSIQARAKLDAQGYVNLMDKIAPESLKLEANGQLALNTVDGREIYNDAFNFLGIESPTDKMIYHLALEEAARAIVLKRVMAAGKNGKQKV